MKMAASVAGATAQFKHASSPVYATGHQIEIGANDVLIMGPWAIYGQIATGLLRRRRLAEARRCLGRVIKVRRR
jgi:hypothetical protein